MIINDKSTREQEVYDVKQRVAGYIDTFKGPINTSGLSKIQNSQLKKHILYVKNIYIQASQAIAAEDKGSEGWIVLNDVITETPKVYAAMYAGIEAFKSGGNEYLNNMESDVLSCGNHEVFLTCEHIYKPSANLHFNEGGNLMIETLEGELAEYSKVTHPQQKAYITAKQIMDWAHELNGAGQPMGALQEFSYKMQLEEKFTAKPSVMNSLIHDKLLAPKVLDIDPSFFEPMIEAGAKRILLSNFIVDSLKAVAMGSMKQTQPSPEQAMQEQAPGEQPAEAPAEDEYFRGIENNEGVLTNETDKSGKVLRYKVMKRNGKYLGVNKQDPKNPYAVNVNAQGEFISTVKK